MRNIMKILVAEKYKSCWYCPFARIVNEHGGECKITGLYVYVMDDVGLPDACPLMTQDEMADWLFFTQPATPMIREALLSGADSPRVEQYVKTLKNKYNC